MYRLQWSWDLKMCPIREVSSFQRVLCTGFNGVGTRRVPNRELSPFQRVFNELPVPIMPSIEHFLLHEWFHSTQLPHSGFGVWHMLVDVVVVYFTLWLLGGTRASVAITWFITMVRIYYFHFCIVYK